MTGTASGFTGLDVFAVEDTAIQVTWHAAPAGGAVLGAGDTTVSVSGPGPGAAVLDSLASDTHHGLRVDGREVASFRTLRPPPGEMLCRFATVSDLHIGERAFGVLPRFHEHGHLSAANAYPARCARAALAEAGAWGAERIVAKGDLTWSGRPLQWETVGEILASSLVPVHATLGNHDVVPRAAGGRDVLARHGIHIRRAPEAIDLPGIRIVIGHSADAHHRHGVIDADQRDFLVRLAATAPAATFLTIHHYVNPLPFRSRYPRGVERAEGQALLRQLASVNPATFLSFGHTHRNRRKTHHGMPATEVGSTKDYPGVWAGYAVHEGGIRQVVRRVAAPACITWTEPVARTVLGLWGLWAPGRRSWRCFTWTWPRR